MQNTLRQPPAEELTVSQKDTFRQNSSFRVYYNDYRMSKRLFSFRQADFIGFCIIKFQKI